MKISENYVIQEFVTPEAYLAFGERSIWFIDERIIKLADWLCDYFKDKVIVNNWHTGGQYHESGLRNFNTTTGATWSQHKRGTAADFKVPGFEPEEVREVIRTYFQSLNTRFGVTTIEQNCPTWVHIDLRWTGLTELLEVPYK